MPFFQSNGSMVEVAASSDLEWVVDVPVEYPHANSRRGYDTPPVRTVVDFIALFISI